MNKIGKLLLVTAVVFSVSQPLRAMENRVMSSNGKDNQGNTSRGREHTSSRSASPRMRPQPVHVAFAPTSTDAKEACIPLSEVAPKSPVLPTRGRHSRNSSSATEGDERSFLRRKDVAHEEGETSADSAFTLLHMGSAAHSSEAAPRLAECSQISPIDASAQQFLAQYNAMKQQLEGHEQLEKNYEKERALARTLQAKVLESSQRLTAFERDKEQQAKHIGELLARDAELQRKLSGYSALEAECIALREQVGRCLEQRTEDAVLEVLSAPRTSRQSRASSRSSNANSSPTLTRISSGSGDVDEGTSAFFEPEEQPQDASERVFEVDPPQPRGIRGVFSELWKGAKDAMNSGNSAE